MKYDDYLNGFKKDESATETQQVIESQNSKWSVVPERQLGTYEFIYVDDKVVLDRNTFEELMKK